MPRGGMMMGRGDFAVTAITMYDFAKAIGQLYLEGNVIDRSGLKGLYDLTLHWTPNELAATEPAGLSIFTAVQEQLGLKLESTKGPVEVLMIDSIQRPSEN
jgi:uncharacterized protein (TIGR03435 family)